jgi:ABC-type xylose transport system, periplasmic component
MNTRRYLVEKEVFISKVEELGGKVYFRSADNDEEKQNQQFNDLLKEGIDILVLDPVNRFRGAEMVRKAHEKGIKVISYDRLVANCDVDALVTFDAKAIGRQMASYALTRIPSGNYIILGGDGSDVNALMIEEAIEKALSTSVTSGNVKILFKALIERYASDECENLTLKCLKLTHKKPDVIITASDAMAQGVLNAFLKENFTGSVLLTGQNAELFACKNIVEGKQAMTIYKPVKKMAAATAELAVKVSKGTQFRDFCKWTINNGSTNVPTWLFDVMTVDASNIKSTVIADGYYTEKEVYNH